MSDNGNTKVVIRCITYNHEKYIRQCLEGFVMQKTDFPFVAIVHDDASTDGTAAIVREYAEKYPDIIKPIFEKENQFSKKDGSLDRIMDEECAKYNPIYLAICEGDDYWTDSNKLQKQVDFFDTHLDYSICFHDVKLYYQDSGLLSDKLDVLDVPETTTILDLSKGNYIHTLSVMYRCNNAYYELKQKIGDNNMLDYAMHMIYAKLGKIYRMRECMGVYRISRDGIWSLKSIDNRYPYWIKMLCSLSTIMELEVRENFYSQIDYLFKDAYRVKIKEGEEIIKSTVRYKIGEFIYPPIIGRFVEKIKKRNGRKSSN